ncbi:MAG: B12-binding domain-containing radical SAM protein [Candidatus Omnitrophica bacterium]|nr:B12-binding domain-containing radical SAM protein [Candidatus Omnitrophota bacterium]
MPIKRIALINPGKDIRFAIQEPLSLGFLASFLEKNNIEVKIIDELAGDDVEKEIISFSPHAVGITATTPLVRRAYEIARFCKKKDILVIMGGPHVSVLSDEALCFADVVVKGEGEEALLKIIRNDIRKGLVIGNYIKNLDDFPPPARHLMHMDYYLYTKDRLRHTYLYFVLPHTRVASILTGRGCRYRCIFCHNSWRNLPLRFNSPERVIQEIEELISKYKIQALFFIEDTLFTDRNRLEEICRLMRKQKIKIIWGANARVNEIDEDILKIAKNAGCRQITFGFESGSQRILNILKKGTTVEQNKKAIHLCRKLGIIPQGTFIIGNPTETAEDIYATLNFIKENPLSGPGVLYSTPFPGTELWNWCREHNLISKDLDWSDFDYAHPIFSCSEEIDYQKLIELHNQIMEVVDLKWHLYFREFLDIQFKPLRKVPYRIFKVFKQPSLIRIFFKNVHKLLTE